MNNFKYIFKMNIYFIWDNDGIDMIFQVCDVIYKVNFFRHIVYNHPQYKLLIINNQKLQKIKINNQFIYNFACYCCDYNKDIQNINSVYTGINKLMFLIKHKFTFHLPEPSLIMHFSISYLSNFLNIDYEISLYIYFLVLKLERQLNIYKNWKPQQLLCEADGVSLSNNDYKHLCLFKRNKTLLCNMLVLVGYNFRKYDEIIIKSYDEMINKMKNPYFMILSCLI
jgi:hypothetical protein